MTVMNMIQAINSAHDVMMARDDGVVPFDPTAVRIAELQDAGVNARLIALTGIKHYEAGRFREPLRQAIPWLQEVWK